MCAEKNEGFEKCMRFQSETGFRLIILVKDDHIAANNIEFCNLVFVLEGEIEFSSSDFLRQRFKQDDFFFLRQVYMELLWLIRVSYYFRLVTGWSFRVTIVPFIVM